MGGSRLPFQPTPRVRLSPGDFLFDVGMLFGPLAPEDFGNTGRAQQSLLLNLPYIHVRARIKTVVAFTILRYWAGVWNCIAGLGTRCIDNPLGRRSTINEIEKMTPFCNVAAAELRISTRGILGIFLMEHFQQPGTVTAEPPDFGFVQWSIPAHGSDLPIQEAVYAIPTEPQVCQSVAALDLAPERPLQV